MASNAVLVIAMLDFLLRLVVDFWATVGEMSPYLLFGFFVAGLLSVFVSQQLVERHLGGRGFLPVLKATLFGIPLPLCSCGVIPVAMSLHSTGRARARRSPSCCPRRRPASIASSSPTASWGRSSPSSDPWRPSSPASWAACWSISSDESGGGRGRTQNSRWTDRRTEDGGLTSGNDGQMTEDALLSLRQSAILHPNPQLEGSSPPERREMLLLPPRRNAPAQVPQRHEVRLRLPAARHRQAAAWSAWSSRP